MKLTKDLLDILTWDTLDQYEVDRIENEYVPYRTEVFYQTRNPVKEVYMIAAIDRFNQQPIWRWVERPEPSQPIALDHVILYHN
jgi:hypothetical protein